jgi:hypothetical protein
VNAALCGRVADGNRAMKKGHRLTLGEKAMAALDEAVAGVVETYRRDGRRLAVWRDGKVVRISAEEAARSRARRERETAR